MTKPPDLPPPSSQTEPHTPKRKLSQPARLFRLLLLPFRLIGYASLLAVVVGFSAVFGLQALDLCQSNGPGIACESQALQAIADFGLTTLYVSVFTGIPLILAFFGLIFLGLDLGRWLHSRRT